MLSPKERRNEELPLGSVVGEYQIDRLLASGGMALVYAATHPVIGKKAAVKIILSSLSSDEVSVGRFVDEARAVNQIGHKNIVDIFAFGALSDGRSYFVMEWLEGESLIERMRHTRIQALEIIDILDQLADALQAAHAKGIVHLDMKPDNVFFLKSESAEVNVKLFDFGIAKLADSRRRASPDPNMVVGTPDYIAPEQASGQPVGPATDVYSLGVMAYEMFVGRLPFVEENTREVMVKHVVEPPPPPSLFWSNIPPALEDLLLGMLSKDPKARPTLAQVRSELNELRRSCILTETSASVPLASSTRPVLGRTFDRTGDLVRPLLLELSRGATWVSGLGDAPPAGSPVTVRFLVERYSVQADFGAIVESHLDENATKSLIRYDQVSSARLDRIFSVAALSPSTTAEPQELPAVWNSGADASSPWVVDLPPSDLLEKPSGAPRKPVPSLARPRSVSHRGDPAKTNPKPTAPLPTSAIPTKEAELWPEEPKAFQLQKPLVGLGMKIVAITLAVTMISVGAILYFGLHHVKEDRAYYVDELTIRTAQYLTERIKGRLEASLVRLQSLALLPENKRAQEDFAHVSRCKDNVCQILIGGALPPEVLDGLRRGVELVRSESGLLFVAHRSQDLWTIGAMSPANLIDGRFLPRNLTAYLLDEDGHVLTSAGANRELSLKGHPIAEMMIKSPIGSQPYATGEGQAMLGAWASGKGFRVFVNVPRSITIRATGRLIERVLWVAAAVLAIVLPVSLLLAQRITRRLRRLMARTARVAAGQFVTDTEISGRDEVGQLAEAFREMTIALKERDRQVLRFQQKLSEDEKLTVQRRMAEWLEAQLARSVHAPAAGEVGRAKTPQLDPEDILSVKAGSVMQRALAFSTMVNRRVDLASATSEAVAVARGMLTRKDVILDLDISNAVLFPRFEGRESEIRELVIMLVLDAAERAAPGARVIVSLYPRGQALLLSVRYPPGPDALARATQCTEKAERLIAENGASRRVQAANDASATVFIAFPTNEGGAEAA